MEPFATYDDFISRYPNCDVDQNVVEAALLDTSAMIQRMWDAKHVYYDTTYEWNDITLRRIVCAAVYRAVSQPKSAGGLDLTGIKQMSWTADSFNEQFTVANPGEDIRLWPSELKLLGLAGGRHKNIHPKTYLWRCDDDYRECDGHHAPGHW